MSSIQLRCIVLIIKHMHFNDMPDLTHFATKPPFYPQSSKHLFSETLDIKHLLKRHMLDPSIISLMTYLMLPSFHLLIALYHIFGHVARVTVF